MKFRLSRHIALWVFLACLTILSNPSIHAQQTADNLVLVTLDGVRWQEVFNGIDRALLDDQRFTHEKEALGEAYWHDDREKRRQRLFPFLWSTLVRDGVLVGDQQQQSNFRVSNPWWFSYPGYNEILTGQADPAIDSNDKNWNKNTTFLEVLNGQERYHDRIRVFGSWEVFPYIINTRRSRIPVNAGFALVETVDTEKVRWLNEVSSEAPRLWPTVREDFLTYGYAREALRTQQPRLLYIALGETDDFAHDGRYDRYIDAAHRADRMLARLWHWLQSSTFYRNRTTLIITTDHGRGRTPEGWQHHASPRATAKLHIAEAPEGIPGSDEVWLAAVGPGIRASGVVQGQWRQAQIAATALENLGFDAKALMPEADEAMRALLSPD